MPKYDWFVIALLTIPCPAQMILPPSGRLNWPPTNVWAVTSAPGAAEQPPGGSISIARLRHRPPRKARAAFFRGMKLDRGGKWQDAAAAFQRAVDLDPEFSEARENLAVEFTVLGRLDEAAAELRRTLVLDPATSVYHSNLAYVLVRLNRQPEGLEQAREAADLDPTNLTAQFLVGLLLAPRPQSRRDAELHLERAAPAFPRAHLLLARLYAVDGASQHSAMEMKAYQESSRRPGQ